MSAAIRTSLSLVAGLTFCLMLVAGCSAGREYDVARKKELAGDAPAAYDAYLKAAERNPGSGAIIGGLKRTAPAAADFWESEAILAANEGRYDDAWRMWMRVLEIQTAHRSAPGVIRQLEQQHGDAVAVARADYLRAGSRTLARATPSGRTPTGSPREGATDTSRDRKGAGFVPGARTAPLRSRLVMGEARAGPRLAERSALPPQSSPPVVEESPGSRVEPTEAPAAESVGASTTAHPQVQPDGGVAATDAKPRREEPAQASVPETNEAKPPAAPPTPESAAPEPVKPVLAPKTFPPPTASPLPKESLSSKASPPPPAPAREKAQSPPAEADGSHRGAFGEGEPPGEPQPREDGPSGEPAAREGEPPGEPAQQELRPPGEPAREEPRPPITPNRAAPAKPSPRVIRPPPTVAPQASKDVDYLAIRWLSKKDRRYPQSAVLVDGITVKLRDTDDDLEADVDLLDGKQRIKKVRGLPVGRSCAFRGRSGGYYQLTILGVQHKTRTVRLGVRPV